MDFLLVLLHLWLEFESFESYVGILQFYTNHIWWVFEPGLPNSKPIVQMNWIKSIRKYSRFYLCPMNLLDQRSKIVFALVPSSLLKFSYEIDWKLLKCTYSCFFSLTVCWINVLCDSLIYVWVILYNKCAKEFFQEQILVTFEVYFDKSLLINSEYARLFGSQTTIMIFKWFDKS